MPDTERQITPEEFHTLVLDCLTGAKLSMDAATAVKDEDFVKALGIERELSQSGAMGSLLIFFTIHAIDTGIVSYETLLSDVSKKHGTVGAARFEARMNDYRTEWEKMKLSIVPAKEPK